MMKLKYLIIFFLTIFIVPIDVYAEVCNREEIERLTKEKNKIEIKYTHLSEEEANTKYQTISDNMYEFSFYNVPKNISITSPYDEGKIKNITPDEYTNVLNTGWAFGGSTIEFSVYTLPEYSCFANLGTIKVKLPWRNIYTKTEECKSYPEFKYCKEYLSSKVTQKTFNTELKRYIKNKENNKLEEIKNQNTITNFIKSNYLYIIGGVILISGISFILINKKQKRRSPL